MKSNQQLDNLNTLANILQLYNTMLLQQDASNNDVLQELRKQNQEIIARLERIEARLSIQAIQQK